MDFNLCKEFGWEPQSFEDQTVEFPHFKKILKWIFGGRLEVTLKKGIEARQMEGFIALLDSIRLEQEEEKARLEREAKLRSMH